MTVDQLRRSANEETSVPQTAVITFKDGLPSQSLDADIALSHKQAAGEEQIQRVPAGDFLCGIGRRNRPTTAVPLRLCARFDQREAMDQRDVDVATIDRPDGGSAFRSERGGYDRRIASSGMV